MSATYKVIKNTTTSDIDLEAVGLTIPASDSYTVEATETPLWATDDSILEITPYINSGDIVINDGTVDLSAADGIRFLKYADRAYIQQDGVDVVRVNTALNFEGNSITVIDEGNGKATINVLDSISDTLVMVECRKIGDCIIHKQVTGLVDNGLNLISKEDC
jgi:hypothetical protein